MGEVYRARDTKLKREVAIKILPEEFSSDPARISRFHREAEVLASLNHPNIGAIYDLLEADGTRFLVLELVEGETLAERTQRAPIAVEEAVQMAVSICEALEAAHEKGVVHRDLKPANVKITSYGRVKVLDFGHIYFLRPNKAPVATEASMFCPQCRAEYRAGFVRCSDCDIELVDQLPLDPPPIDLLRDVETGLPVLVVVRTYVKRLDADLARTALEAAGIESVVRRAFLRGIELLVRPEDAQEAKAVLSVDVTDASTPSTPI